jgi:hypothetical protein
MYKEKSTNSVASSASGSDYEIVRELAREVARIAALPEQAETIAMWKALNRLEPVRPMVTIDQICWNEMNVDDELTLRCEDKFCRGLEGGLRRIIYRWNHMRADMVVRPIINIGRAVHSTGYGLSVVDRRAVTDPTNGVVGHFYEDQLKTDEDVEKIQAPVITHDGEETERRLTRALEIFDGILEVRPAGRNPYFNTWDRISTLRGVQNLLLDIIDRPDFMHRIIGRFTDARLAELDQLEEQGLLEFDQDLIHCSGAYSDELPAEGADPARPRPKDIWTAGMSQIFGTVSPAMHKEFDLDYSKKWYERFGLVNYGCCEPLDTKLDIVRTVPNLRKISMSPWVNVERGAEGIGREYVFLRKPSPSPLASDSFDGEAVEKDLRQTKEACAHFGCPLEYNLKDISTVRYDPQRLWDWERIAMKVVRG